MDLQRAVPSGDIRAFLKTTGNLLLASVGPGFPGWLTEVLTLDLDLDLAWSHEWFPEGSSTKEGRPA